MASNLPATPPAHRHPTQGDDLLLREALADVMERVSVLAHARRTLHQDRPSTLEVALRQVCDALHAQAEPRSILISLKSGYDVKGLSAHRITTLALVVNELATNAIKHAFEEDRAGQVQVTIVGERGGEVVILVDDDGLPFPPSSADGLGMGLARRLMASIDGLIIPPAPGKKVFELRVPAT
jgi:two-component sensor histidine kinase